MVFGPFVPEKGIDLVAFASPLDLTSSSPQRVNLLVMVKSNALLSSFAINCNQRGRTACQSAAGHCMASCSHQT